MSDKLEKFKSEIENLSLHDLKALRTALFSDEEEDYATDHCNKESIASEKIKIIDKIIKDRE